MVHAAYTMLPMMMLIMVADSMRNKFTIGQINKLIWFILLCYMLHTFMEYLIRHSLLCCSQCDIAPNININIAVYDEINN